MNNGGFGFNFGPHDDDDEERKRRQDGNGDGGNGANDNPFNIFGFGSAGGGAAGGLGDMLNQFGQMLSGMGSSMNSPEGQGAVNYALAERIARQQISSNSGASKAISASDLTAVEEAVRLSDLWLDQATDLPTGGGRAQAWNAEDWFSNTLPMWKRLVTPVAEHMNSAQLESLPEEARQMMGPMAHMMKQMASMNFGMQLGNALGELANQALTGSDFGLPVAPAEVTALLPHNIASAAKALETPTQEVIVYIAARESARQRLYRHVPWLVERLVSSVEEYAQGLVIDTSHIEEAARELNLDSADPSSIQSAMEKLQGMDLSPRISSRNAQAVARLETLLALVEGWVEHVVNQALSERIPSTAAMSAAWRRRQDSGGSAEQAFAKIVGIELAAPKVAEAAELWRRVDIAVGQQRRDQVWDHPDLLPSAHHLDNSAEFIDSLLDDSTADGFDEELAKLEQMLREQSTPEQSTPEQGEEGTTSQGEDPDSSDPDQPSQP